MDTKTVDFLDNVKAKLISQATSGYQSTFRVGEYEEMRRSLMSNLEIADRIPRFIKSNLTAEAFFRYMQAESKTYQGRRELISGEMNTLIEYAEQLITSKDPFTTEIRIEDDALIGKGGYSEVYKDYNKHLDMCFAIKVYSPFYAIETDQYDGERRFFREAKMLFSLNHEGIVRVYDAGRINNKPYIKMEFVDGFTLYKYHEKNGNLSFEKSKSVIIKITEAIGYAHKKGVLHRDLKPGNILYDSSLQRFVVIDFGVSAFLDADRHTRLTKAGENVAGSSFTDPLLETNPALRDVRSDIYSIGAIWYYLLTGRTPAGSDMEKVLSTTNPYMKKDQIEIVMKCMRGNINDRYANCDELLSFLNIDVTNSDATNNDVRISSILSQITTDDERVLLFYILQKKVRTITKSSFKTWLNKNEIYQINVDNAFDLISILSEGNYLNDELTLGIGLFRECTRNSESLVANLKQYVNSHTKLASNTFNEIINTFDSTMWLFVAYIVETRMFSFGDRWMSEFQIKSIREWESDNILDAHLSQNYGGCLEIFIQNDLVYESAWTSYGNPKEYTLNPSLKQTLLNCPSDIKKEIDIVKQLHFADIPF